MQWYPDGSAVAFVSTSRDHKRATLRVADAGTGVVRDVLTETVATQYESGNGRANWLVAPLHARGDLVFRARGLGHLYLYDLETGRSSAGHERSRNVVQLMRVDQRNAPSGSPDWPDGGAGSLLPSLYRVGMDGDELTLLTPEAGDHDVALTPSGRWFVDTYARPDEPSVTVLRDIYGRLISTLERADASRLLASGWKPPTPISVKGRDGRTDLYGLMYTPTTLDSSRRYPIINHIYPGPQTGSVGGRGFVPARGDAQRSRARVRRGRDRRHGHSVALQDLHDAYYAASATTRFPIRSRDARARGTLPVHRHRPRRIYATLGRLRRAARCSATPTSQSISESGNHPTAPTRTTGESATRACSSAPATAATATPPTHHTSRATQGKLLLAHARWTTTCAQHTLLVVEASSRQQGLRPADAPQPAARYGTMSPYRCGVAGLLREAPARSGAAEGVRDRHRTAVT